MANTEAQNLDALLANIEQEQHFVYNRASIEQEAQHGAFRIKSIAIKALTILGGFLAASTFLGFLGAAGLYESAVAMMVVGVMFLVGAEWLIQSKKEATADSIGVAFNIMGYLLLGIGVGQLTESASAVCGVLACAAVLVLLFSESAICVFISVLVLNGSLLGLIYDNKIYNVAHGLVVLLAAVLTYMSLNEAKLITASPKLNAKYRPVRMGVVFSLVLTLGLLVHQKLLSSNVQHFWIASLFLIACFLYLLYRVMKEAAITNTKTQVAFYTCCILLLAPTIFTPSIPGALLVLLSSFYIGHRPGFWVGLLALVYFVILYYYDLNMTLLAKSGVLVASGLLFLGGFVLLNRYLKSYAD